MSKPLENITFEGVPLADIIGERKNTEIERVKRREIHEKSFGVGYMGSTSRYGNTSGERSQARHHTGELSKEVIEHLNFLRRSKGDNAVTEYLGQQQRSGSIESVIEDAKQKIKFYAAEAARAQQEVQRWEAVKSQLEGALGLVTGRAPVPTSGVNGGVRGRAPSRDWQQILKDVMGDKTLTRKELRVAVKAAVPGVQDQNVYMAVATGLKREYLLETEKGITFVGPAPTVL